MVVVANIALLFIDKIISSTYQGHITQLGLAKPSIFYLAIALRVNTQDLMITYSYRTRNNSARLGIIIIVLLGSLYIKIVLLADVNLPELGELEIV